MKSTKRTGVKASKKTAPKGAGRAAPPPDNPLLRHEELSSDRCIEGVETFAPGARLLTALAATSGRKRLKVGKRKAKESTAPKHAKLRLAAQEHSRRIAGHDAGGPVMAMSRALSAAAPGGIAMVAPVAGWIRPTRTSSTSARRKGAFGRPPTAASTGRRKVTTKYRLRLARWRWTRVIT